MPLLQECIDTIRRFDCCSYSAEGPWAAEPTALACLALAACNELAHARSLGTQLADVQLVGGAVTADGAADSPAWTTSLAILAWLSCKGFDANVARAIDWTLKTHGKPAPRNPRIGHDPTIPGWSWAADTHSWMEPTAMFVTALKAAGLGDHRRTRDGVRLLTDRLLPTGGSNFGSTLVLGQATLPQVQSTGLAMLALAGEENADPRIELSLEYLETNLNKRTATASLCYGLMGLTAHNRRPSHAEALLTSALHRECNRHRCAFKLALLALASLSDMSWLPDRVEAIHA